MSTKHPIIAVTGISGAETIATRGVFQNSFEKRGAVPDSGGFHCYESQSTDVTIRTECKQSRNIRCFVLKANDFPHLESTFHQYNKEGQGHTRRYLHMFDEAALGHQIPSIWVAWKTLPEQTDLLFYDGLHGGIVASKYDVAAYVDHLIIVNLEWIQKMVCGARERRHLHEIGKRYDTFT